MILNSFSIEYLDKSVEWKIFKFGSNITRGWHHGTVGSWRSLKRCQISIRSNCRLARITSKYSTISLFQCLSNHLQRDLSCGNYLTVRKLKTCCMQFIKLPLFFRGQIYLLLKIMLYTLIFTKFRDLGLLVQSSAYQHFNMLSNHKQL